MPHLKGPPTAIDLEGSSGKVPARREVDETDYAHRTFVNLLAAIFLLLIALAIVWTVQKIDAQEKLRRCLDTGGRECVQLVPPRPGVRLPAR